MFERMEMRAIDTINDMDIEEDKETTQSSGSTTVAVNSAAVENEIQISMFDKTYFKRCLLMDHEFVCHLLENCKESLNCDKYVNERNKYINMQFYFILTIFTIGMVVGGVIALCCCQAMVYCATDKRVQQRERIHRQNATRSRTTFNDPNRSSEAVLLPRQESTVDSYDQSLVETNPFQDFVQDLFSRRRPRRQYLSSLGQSGTNLVRHLSRNSLNMLRRSQYRANLNNNPHSPTSPVSTTSTSDDNRPVTARSFSFVVYDRPEDETTINHNNEFILGELRRQRPCTPPPQYEQCVNKNEFDKRSI